MLIKMLKTDFLKNKVITAALFSFIMLSALLIASGTNMLTELANSLNSLFTKSDVPHFVQMHTGDIDQADIAEFAANNSMVKSNQTVEMVHIDGLNLEMGKNASAGEIAVPIYYMQQENMKIGDTIRVFSKTVDMELTVVDFIRDVQMNPSIILKIRYYACINNVC